MDGQLIIQERLKLLSEYMNDLWELLPNLINMARFRNLIVHDYARIDNEVVFAILKRRLGDFDAYAQAIAHYLESTSSGDFC